MFAVSLLLAAAAFQPEIPKTWDDRAVAALEVPLVRPDYSPRHISEADYYRIPERTIWLDYRVYHPSREPEGYREWLESREPRIAFDPATLRTRQDWIAAGERVFHSGTSFGPVFFGADDVRDPKFFADTGTPVAADGTIPFARWVVREQGTVELATMGCNTCHTRVMHDGTVVAGAQGNNPGDRQGARMLRAAARFAPPETLLDRVRGFARQFELPWSANDPNRRPRSMSLDEILAAGEAIPPGVTARSFTSMILPPRIPDLIGVRERRYLDNTGLVRHRSIGDLMRYSSLVQDMMKFARRGPGAPPPDLSKPGVRYSDAQLYALALFLYSLEPPPNPHPFDERARAGQAVFEREKCGRCHTPPLYTNNKLVPVDGFRPPRGGPDETMARPIGVDPGSARATLKGTGYYKVPSLKGVWYRGPFEHNGSAATLENWFDPRRLREDYVPTGFRGHGARARAVPGHEFGLKLSADDRAALIAFLKTL